MSLQERAVLVTNDDQSITYIGNWTTVPASALNDGNYGPTFSPTSHSTTSTSSFSFAFNGSSVSVFGTVNVTNSSTDPDPTWRCFVDGISLGAPNVFNAFENNWPLCDQENIPDGAHKLVVSVTSQGMPFYLDNIQYRPSPSVSLEDSLIVIQNNDPAVDYISGWGALGGTANQTTDPNGLVNVTFIGTQLSWYGFIPTEEPHNASSGEYSIDGQPFSSFSLSGLPQSVTPTVYNQLFFTTTILEMGPHMLSAKYTGKPGLTPFTLDYLVVTNGSFSSINPSTPSNSAGEDPTSVPSPIDTADSSSHDRNIVGGVVGCIGGILVCSTIIIIWLRLRKGRRYFRNKVIQRRNAMESHFIRPYIVSPAATPLALNRTAGLQGTYVYSSSLLTNYELPNSRSSTSVYSVCTRTKIYTGSDNTGTITIRREDGGVRVPQSLFDVTVLESPPKSSKL